VEGPDHFSRRRQIFKPVELYRGDLQRWRDTLPQHLKWDDRDDKAPNVVGARLRAEYYKAMFRVHLPLLDFTLNILPGLANDSNVRDIVEKGHKTLGSSVRIQFFESIDTRDIDRIHEACAVCLDAAVSSITYYHSTVRSWGPLRHQDIANT
jgi:hypothetical protein